MPVGPQHAFAKGRVFARPGLLRRLIPTGAAATWRSFDRGAVVGNNCLFGASAWCANTGSAEAVVLGSGVICRGLIRRESFGDGRIEVHDDVYIGDDCIVSCADNVVIERDVLLGHGVQIFDNDSHPVDPVLRRADWRAVRTGEPRQPIGHAPIRICDGAWIGFHAVILKGVTVGRDAIVGAYAVVTDDVPDCATVAGNPARMVRSGTPRQ